MLKRLFVDIRATVRAIWREINGHKTNIGSFLVTVYTFAVHANLVTYNADVLTVLAIIFGVGVTHKGVKYVQSTK